MLNLNCTLLSLIVLYTRAHVMYTVHVSSSNIYFILPIRVDTRNYESEPIYVRMILSTYEHLVVRYILIY